MRFRAKIFLAILVPSTVLVALAVATALSVDNHVAEEDARRDFERLRTAFQKTIEAQLKNLLKESDAFKGPRFQEAVSTASESGDLVIVEEILNYEFKVIGKFPDFYELRGRTGKSLLRHPPAPKAGAAPGTTPAPEKPVLTELDGAPFVMILLEYDHGTFTLGHHVRAALDSLSENFSIGLILMKGGRVLYSSVTGWSPSSGSEGAVHVEGTRYLGRTEQPGHSDLSMVLLKSMKELDLRKSRLLLMGAAGLSAALVLAGIISIMVSSGVSKPVEVLTEAARKVAAGDYGVKVEINEKGEMGRLGTAFNEMTVGLRKRQEIMDKTLSRDVAEEFLKGTERGGERRVVTIVFMDIRGFTSGTEGVDPADVLEMLNDLMELLAGAIEKHGGIVNKFLGDGLMAMFGAPKPLEGHAARAVRAGLEMQEKMRIWNGSRHARGLSSFYSGIGINTGTAVCGKVGARTRLEYTLIGEEVNLTSRICGKAAPRQVLITKQVLVQAGEEFKVKPLEPVQVKGLSYPIEIYEVLG